MIDNPPPKGRDHYKGHPNGSRIVVYILIVLALSIIVTISVIGIVKGATRSGNICERHNMVKQITRGGKSWRCARISKSRSANAPSASMRYEPVSLELIDGIRTVRTVPMFYGITVNQRIERAFDKVMLFPVEDEP